MADDTMRSSKIKKQEYVRLIGEALQHLGYQDTSKCLESESQIPVSSPQVSRFTELILDGKWDASLTALREIAGLDESSVKSISFVILEEKFLYHLENDNHQDALTVLRREITPLHIEENRVRELSSLVLLNRSRETSGRPKPTTEVLATLQRLFPPSVLIPRGRLLELVRQAFQNTYVDQDGTRMQLPTHTSQILQRHNDEVLFLQFSHNGRFLASGSKDKTAIIWGVRPDGTGLELRHILRGHIAPVCCLSWSPSDDQLLTCGLEESVKRWDVETGRCVGAYRDRNRGMISCDWCPDGQSIFLGLNSGSILMWDLDGNKLDSWMRSTTANSSNLQISRDGKRIISVSGEKKISVIEREGGVHTVIEENEKIVSFVLGGDDKFLLVSLENGETHLWSIFDGEEKQVVGNYKGRTTCTRFVVRACFGGAGEALIASGSEDSRVYIWHKETGELLKTLRGHVGAVNCTSWNPMTTHMLASGSADGSIHLWGLNPNHPPA